MTPERLAQLRGMVERGDLGCGPVTEALVRELLRERDALALTTQQKAASPEDPPPPAPRPRVVG